MKSGEKEFIGFAIYFTGTVANLTNSLRSNSLIPASEAETGARVRSARVIRAKTRGWRGLRNEEHGSGMLCKVCRTSLAKNI